MAGPVRSRPRNWVRLTLTMRISRPTMRDGVSRSPVPRLQHPEKGSARRTAESPVALEQRNRAAGDRRAQSDGLQAGHLAGCGLGHDGGEAAAAQSRHDGPDRVGVDSDSRLRVVGAQVTIDRLTRGEAGIEQCEVDVLEFRNGEFNVDKSGMAGVNDETKLFVIEWLS